ncbi:FeoA family protein [Demequina capsici]|uniref:FeoA family protein n=1 Tax=Demequina capsici TaxID=3075620 RepID=A0AA96FAZ2_9MICO|nr:MULTISPECIES: FeoA family protein [unclassified Demequina]WNM24574.1 FeoA family protein [Demequina sp. OYTSA14]WNM27426.1 FeoA family protein [Demequina sp. PMTSA13]
MTLADLPRGAQARVRAVSAEADAALRLREMGLRPGTLVRVVGIAAAGARVVGIGAARIAVDLQTARCVGVEPVPDALTSAAHA